MSRRSLFVLSLPRSLSTQVYRLGARALDLETPGWADNGEILNHDLHCLSRWPKIVDSGQMFVTQESDPRRFAKALRLLDDATRREGAAYKDVVNPFVVGAWPGLTRFAVLKIRRDVAEVAYAMIRRGWFYPSRAGRELGNGSSAIVRRLTDERVWTSYLRRMTRARTHGRWTARLLRRDLILGLLRGERCLQAIPGVSVEFAELVENRAALQTALERLYPGAAFEVEDYVDAEFRGAGRRRRAERDEAEFRRIQDDVRRLREVAGDGR